MQMFMYIGVISGVILYICKAASFHLLCPPWLYRWMSKRPVVLGILDILFGFAGMHIVSIAGGSVIAMITMITFGLCSMIYIVGVISFYKAKSMYETHIYDHIIR